jgi:hypothetical protein
MRTRSLTQLETISYYRTVLLVFLYAQNNRLNNVDGFELTTKQR